MGWRARVRAKVEVRVRARVGARVRVSALRRRLVGSGRDQACEQAADSQGRRVPVVRMR